MTGITTDLVCRIDHSFETRSCRFCPNSRKSSFNAVGFVIEDTVRILRSKKNESMANTEREIQRNVDLMASARNLNKRFELVSKKYQQVLGETRRLQELMKWQRFFGYETNATEFFERLDRKTVPNGRVSSALETRGPDRVQSNI